MAPLHERYVTYEIERDQLVRWVTPRKGSPYVHRCDRESFEAVAHEVDAHPREGVTSTMLHNLLSIPHSQVVVALEFLKERGCVVTHRKRSFPATGDVHCDAMIEWHDLREKPAEA